MIDSTPIRVVKHLDNCEINLISVTILYKPTLNVVVERTSFNKKNIQLDKLLTITYSLEQNTFIIVFYYRNGTVYSVSASKKSKHSAKFTDENVTEHTGVVGRFVKTESVNKGKSL